MMKLAQLVGMGATIVCLTGGSYQLPTLAQGESISPLPSTRCDPNRAENSLQVGESVLAKRTGGSKDSPELTPHPTSVYRPGEVVYLVLQNSGPFQADDRGQHYVEMDVRVKDSRGNILLERQMLLGEKGRLFLQNNMASSPYGNVDTTRDTPAGKYTIVVTIYDMVACTKAIRTRPFRVIR